MTAAMVERTEGKFFKRDPKTGRVSGIPLGDEPMARKPICARFPVDVDEVLRNIPNRSEFIRAVVSKAVRELEDE